MGTTLSKNTVEDGVNISVNVLNQANQICQTQYLESQELTVINTGSGTVTVGPVDWSEVVTLNLACTQTSTAKNSINNSLQQTISQIAKSIEQSFELPHGSIKAQNNTKLWTDLGTTIQNVYDQTCKATLTQNQAASFTNKGSGDIIVGNLNWSEAVNSMITCIQNDASVTAIKNKIVQNISQEAVSEVESIFGPLIAIIVIIIIIIGFFMFSTVFNWKFILVIVIVVIVYLITSYSLGWWPFSTKT